jgi:hypothetical protein
MRLTYVGHVWYLHSLGLQIKNFKTSILGSLTIAGECQHNLDIEHRSDVWSLLEV